MRVFDIISEATLDIDNFQARNPNYYRNLINLIKGGTPVQVNTGKFAGDIVFSPEAADILEKIWNPTGIGRGEIATPEQTALMKQALLPATNGISYKVNQIEKTKDIKQVIGATGETTNSKWWNKGNVAEGIMAAAVVTKFERHGDEIVGEDVFRTVQKIQGKEYKTKSFGRALLLNITISINDTKALLMSALQPAEFLEFDKAREIYKLYEDCASYVNNSGNVKDALEKIKQSGPKDAIQVIADGATAEAQSSTKADLWISLNGKKERLLSIKTATVKHIGAVSGYEFHHINSFFTSVVGFGLPDTFKKLFKAPPTGLPKGWKKGDPVPAGYVKMSQADRSAKIAEVRAHNYANGTKKAYEYIYKEINKRLKGPTDQQEYDFVTTVATGVVHHATLGEDVRLVIISPSAKVAYKELKFGPELYDALTQYDLVPVLNLEGANYKLLVYGYPKTQTAKRVNNDKSLFVQLRSYVQDSAARNVVEIGGLLKDLTDVSKLENTASTELPEPTLAPKPVAPVAKKTAVKKPAVTTPIVAQEPAIEPAELPAEEIPPAV